jgi:hypothetical protein
MSIEPLRFGSACILKNFTLVHPLRISGSNLNSALIQKLVSQFNRQDGEIDRTGFTKDELLDLHVQLNWLQHALMETFTSPRCEGTGV